MSAQGDRRVIFIGWPRQRGEGCEVTAFSDRMVSEIVQTFWAAMQQGEFITDAAELAGTCRKEGTRWLAAAGGVRSRRGRNLKGRCLSFAEREEIAVGRAGGESLRSIAVRLGRSPSTISRELVLNADRHGCYRARTAHALAYNRASRPKPAKLATNLLLRGKVEQDLEKKYSRRTDRRPAASGVPRRPGDVGVDRDHLPVVVRAVPRCATPRTHEVPAHRSGAAPTQPQTRANARTGSPT